MDIGLEKLLPRSEWNRRGFVVTSLASGFALAVQPVSADEIKTDAEGLDAAEVKVKTEDGEMPAYRAVPKEGKDFPIVLVVQEIFGVHEHIKDVCRRFAKLGYLAIAPELYARQGDVSKIADFRKIMSDVVSKVPDAQVMGDLDACVAWAKEQKGDVSKLAITGFCWGGRIVWLYAAHNKDLKAAAAWYGRLVGETDEHRPKHPIDIADKLLAPVLGLYGGADRGIPNETVEKMQAKLKEAGGKSSIHVYPDTPHGFHADYRPSYRKEQAEDAWKRLKEWFEANGVKPATT
jgi:carboxymethylenebutenolidase